MAFLSSACPLIQEEAEWVELSLLWFIKQFGLAAFHDIEVVLPLPKYFPEPYSGTERCVRHVFERVCGYMGIPAEQVDIEIFSRSSPLGLYQQNPYSGRACISVNACVLDKPYRLIAVIAHELAHHLLLKGKKLSRHDDDQEYLTDLLPVFFGLGIFNANAVWEFEHGDVTIRSKAGYLTESIYAYALASFAWMKDEHNPAWPKLLNLNVRLLFQQGLRYLNKEGDRIFSEPLQGLKRLKLHDEIQEIRILEEKKTREMIEHTQQKTDRTFQKVTQLFSQMLIGHISEQASGHVFEYVLQELIKQSDAEVLHPLKMHGESIAGIMAYTSEYYVIEAKWQEKEASDEAIYRFAAKIEAESYGTGVFISVHGYCPHVIAMLSQSKAFKTIFIDGEDLMLILEQRLSLLQLFDSKIQAARTQGLVYSHPVTGDSKL